MNLQKVGDFCRLCTSAPDLTLWFYTSYHFMAEFLFTVLLTVDCGIVSREVISQLSLLHWWHLLTVQCWSSLSFWNWSILSQMTVEAVCIPSCLILYTYSQLGCSNGWFGCVNEYLVHLNHAVMSSIWCHYLFLEEIVIEVEDFYCAISPGHSQPLSLTVERHGPDSTRHVVEEADSVYFKLAHYWLENRKKGSLISVTDGQKKQNNTHKTTFNSILKFIEGFS